MYIRLEKRKNVIKHLIKIYNIIEINLKNIYNPKFKVKMDYVKL